MKTGIIARTLVTVLPLALLVISTSAEAIDPAEKCGAGKLKEAGKYANCLMKAESKAAKKREVPDFTKCNEKFPEKWGKIEEKGEGACPSIGDVTTVQDAVAACMGDVAADLALAPDCTGVEVAGSCWIEGPSGLSCDEACDAVGRVYDEATRTYAGSDGSLSNCHSVMLALGVALPAPPPINGDCTPDGLGCVTTFDNFPFYCGNPATTSDAVSSVIGQPARRICACAP